MEATHDNEIYCCYLKRLAPAFKRPPIPGPMGKKLMASISEEAWDVWLIEQTKLLNEQRLNPMEEKDREKLLHHMKKFLSLTDE